MYFFRQDDNSKKILAINMRPYLILILMYITLHYSIRMNTNTMECYIQRAGRRGDSSPAAGSARGTHS